MLSRSRLALSLLLLFSLFLFSSSASAQEGDPEGPQYVVQPGDTLSSIALRFDTPMADIIAASDLANPDALNVGDVLVIPGIDWIDGTLIFEDMPLGETFLSLQRRYLLTEENMVRLNRLTSPGQLYAGFSIMLATERGELDGAGRAAVAPGQSLLELAVINGDNPWALAVYNQLPGTWAAVPGDVLFTPAVQSPGPGALPSAISSISIEDPGFVRGKTTVINVVASPDVALGGELIDHPLHFVQEAEGQWVSLQGLPLEADPGTYTFTLSGKVGAAEFTVAQPFRMADGFYESETLTVGEEFLNPDQSSAETDQVNALVAEATPEKMWSGFWGPPHPYTNVINSEYGVHRLYNGGAFEGYHYGVDFGGGVGIEIWAPARGRVVFAGSLDIRGNVTIIDHGWGIYTGYFHQSEQLVNEGDIVEPGQLIGLVGNTGRSSGAHLHWEVWAGGVAVEPLDWLARQFP